MNEIDFIMMWLSCSYLAFFILIIFLKKLFRQVILKDLILVTFVGLFGPIGLFAILIVVMVETFVNIRLNKVII